MQVLLELLVRWDQQGLLGLLVLWALQGKLAWPDQRVQLET